MSGKGSCTGSTRRLQGFSSWRRPPIARDPRDRKRMAIVSTGRAARTDFVRLARFDAADLLRAHLHTGRTHQIRQHLQESYRSILGDNIYGGKSSDVPRLMLHAFQLNFPHPITKVQTNVEAPLPQDFKKLLSHLHQG